MEVHSSCVDNEFPPLSLGLKGESWGLEFLFPFPQELS